MAIAAPGAVIKNWSCRIVVVDRMSDALTALKVDDVYDDEPGVAYTKLGGGGGNEEGELTPLETGIRELGEETGLRPKAGVTPRFLCKKLEGEHLKEWYFLWRDECEGKLKTSPVIEESGVTSGQEFVDIYELRGRLAPSQWLAWDKMLEEIRKSVR